MVQGSKRALPPSESRRQWKCTVHGHGRAYRTRMAEIVMENTDSEGSDGLQPRQDHAAPPGHDAEHDAEHAAPPEYAEEDDAEDDKEGASEVRGSKCALPDDGDKQEIPGKCCSRGCNSNAKYIAVADVKVPIPPEFASLQTLCGLRLWNQVGRADVARLARFVLLLCEVCSLAVQVGHCVPRHAGADGRLQLVTCDSCADPERVQQGERFQRRAHHRAQRVLYTVLRARLRKLQGYTGCCSDVARIWVAFVRSCIRAPWDATREGPRASE